MNKRKKSEKLFKEGANCAQAVLCTFCDETGMDNETAMKIASSFGGGMGRMREVCGACSGMFMVAGLICGYSDMGARKEKKEHYELIQALAKKFKEKNGTIICHELLANNNVDNSPNPSERTETYYKKRPCSEYVGDAAEIIEEFLCKNNNICR